MSLLLVAVVAFTYFGGQNVPKVLKDNKQMVLGVFVGVLLHQFMGVSIEGFGDKFTSYKKGNGYNEELCIDCIQYATSSMKNKNNVPLDLLCRSSDITKMNSPCDGAGVDPETAPYEGLLELYSGTTEYPLPPLGGT